MSPGGMRKVDGYQVKWGKEITAKKSSKKNARAQLNLLHGIEGGWRPTGKPSGLAAMAENEAYRKKPKKKKRG